MDRRRVFQLLEVASHGDRWSRAVDQGLALLILANVVALLLESTEPVGEAPWGYRAFEACSVAIFTVEYALRLWSAPEHPAFRGAVVGRLRWAFTPLALLDLAAVLPALLTPVLVVGVDLRVVRAARILRILRLGKLGRYSIAMQAIARALRQKSGELASVLFVLLVVLTIASSLMYYVEQDANPGAFPSIPAAMWWGIATLTTVGYGDVVPLTAPGKLLGAVIAVLGIGLFALPAAILSSAFTDQLRTRDPAPHGAGPHGAGPHGLGPHGLGSHSTCPHCGRDLADPPS